ncbi:MAG: hypothetical protein ACFE7S_06805 [Candidatus Hodarchaeota archaeon]
MSEILLDNLFPWFEERTKGKLRPIKKRGEQICDKIEGFLARIEDAAEKLLMSKDRDAYRGAEQDPKRHELAVRSADKLSEKVTERIREFKIPENITYDNLRDLGENLKEFFAFVNGAGRRWVPKMSPWFKSELKDIDYFLKKLTQTSKELQNFIHVEYKEVKSIEDIINSIEDIKTAVDENRIIDTEIETASKKLKSLENTRADLKKDLTDLMETGKSKDLTEIRNNEASLRQLFNRYFRPLKKPLRKLKVSIERGQYSMGMEQQSTMNKYLDRPFVTFLEEEEGYPLLKIVLNGLRSSLANKKLSMKPSRTNKALKQIKDICEGDALLDLQKKGKSMTLIKAKLETELELTEHREKQLRLQEDIERTEKERRGIEAKLSNLQVEFDRNQEKISRYKKEIEEDIRKTVKDNISVKI